MTNHQIQLKQTEMLTDKIVFVEKRHVMTLP